jgi:hypothetical protein
MKKCFLPTYLMICFQVIQFIPQNSYASDRMAEKSTEIYNELSTKVYNSLESIRFNNAHYINPAKSQAKGSLVEGRTIKIEDIQKEFSEYCMDRDYSDTIETANNNEDSITKVTFVCDSDTEVSDKKVFSFDFSTDKSTKELRDIIAFSKMDTTKKKEVSAKLGIKEVVTGSVAIAVAYYVAGELIKEIYPNRIDRYKHATYSVVISGVATAFYRYVLKQSPEKALINGFGFSFLVGLGEEIRDAKNGSGDMPDHKRDLVSDTIGSALGASAMWLSLKYTYRWK